MFVFNDKTASVISHQTWSRLEVCLFQRRLHAQGTPTLASDSLRSLWASLSLYHTHNEETEAEWDTQGVKITFLFVMIRCVIDHFIRTDNTKSISLSLNAATQCRKKVLFFSKAPNYACWGWDADTQQVDDWELDIHHCFLATWLPVVNTLI